MSTSPRQTGHQVEHSFQGPQNILKATFAQRDAIRRLLTTLAEDLQRDQGQPTQVNAEIKLRIGGVEPKQYVYTVDVTEGAFDAGEFDRLVISLEDEPSVADLDTAINPSGASIAQTNVQQTSPTGPESRRANGKGHAEIIEIRPFKRPKPNQDRSTPDSGQVKGVEAFPKESPTPAKDRSGGRMDELLAYIEEWHAEWLAQGGWIFDNVSKLNTSSDSNRAALQQELIAVQDILGQALNSASASTLSELSRISKLIPWLEDCRKSSADKVQAREEKWRTSSATFHDQSRQDRAAAEKRMEKRLEAQHRLLLKVAKASGVLLDGTEAVEDIESDSGSREASLGAQLTRELNMEAARSAKDDAIE